MAKMNDKTQVETAASVWATVRQITSGIIVLNTGELVSGVKIIPRNIFIMQQDDTNAIIYSLSKFYDSIDFDYWLIIGDRPVNLNTYFESVQNIYNTSSSEHVRAIARDDIVKANKYVSGDYGVSDTEYFLLFKDKSIDMIQQKISKIISGIKECELNATQVSNDELRLVMDTFLSNGKKAIAMGDDVSDDKENNDVKFDDTYFKYSGTYSTILSVIGYPNRVYPGFLSGLINIPNARISIKYQKTQFDSLKKIVGREIAILKQKYQTERDLALQEKLRTDYENLESYLKTIKDQDIQIFNTCMNIMVSAETLELLEEHKNNVRRYLDNMGISSIIMIKELDAVLKSMLPIFDDQLVTRRINIPIPSYTMSTMYPYVFDSLKDPGESYLVGGDFSGGVVLFNQFSHLKDTSSNRYNANIICVGQKITGKTTLLKLLTRGNVRNGNVVSLVDGSSEYESMTSNYGGDYITLDSDYTQGVLNPLEIVNDVTEDEKKQGLNYTALVRTITFLKGLLKFINPTVEDDVEKKFEEVLYATYKRFHIDMETDYSTIQSSQYPIFNDVYATVKGSYLSSPEGSAERDVLKRLEACVNPFVTTYAKFFNGHTNFDMRDNFITFGVNYLNTPTPVKLALEFVALKYCWMRSCDVKHYSSIVFDNINLLFSTDNSYAADSISQMVRRSILFHNGCIFSIENTKDLVYQHTISYTKSIFDNSSYFFIMSLRKQEFSYLSRMIEFNDAEESFIKSIGKGDALFLCGSRRLRLNVIVSDEELTSFGLNIDFQ